MSRRVVEVLNSYSPRLDVDSIDETFVDLSGFGDRMEAHAARMRAAVRIETGIPTCVGIGPTKTLSKLANYAAKKNPIFSGVCNLMNAEIVTNEMLLECIQDIQRDLDEMKVGLTSFQSELQAVNKEMSLFLQPRLGEEQPD